jgi:hypothetical protein
LAGVDKSEAIPAIVKLVKTKTYGIADAYRDTVESAYERRDLLTKVQGIEEKLKGIKATSLSADLQRALNALRSQTTWSVSHAL